MGNSCGREEDSRICTIPSLFLCSASSEPVKAHLTLTCPCKRVVIENMAAYQPRALMQCCAIETREAHQFMEEARTKKSPDSAPAVQGTTVPTEIALYDNDWTISSGEFYVKSLKMSEDSRTTRLYCSGCWTLLMVEAPWFAAEAAINESLGVDAHTFNVTGVYSAMHASHEIDGEVKSTVLDPMIESAEHQARLCESEWTDDLGPLPKKEHEYASFQDTYMLDTCLVNAHLRTFIRPYAAPEVRTPLEGTTMAALASKAGTDVDASLDPQEFLDRAAAKRAESLENFKAKQQEEQPTVNTEESLQATKSAPGSPEAELDERQQRILTAQRKKEQDELLQKRKDEQAEEERKRSAKRLAEQQEAAKEAKQKRHQEEIRRAREKKNQEDKAKADVKDKATDEAGTASCSVQ